MIKAILLAAGKSKRLKSENKLIKKFKNKALINHSLQALFKSKVDKIVIVLGYQNKEVRNVIKKNKKNIFVLNKIDLTKKKAPVGGFAISAKTKKNLNLLKKELARNFLKLKQEELLSVNIRHLDLIKKAYKNIALISPGLVSSNLELVAENLRNCDELLGEIYDPISSDDMLGKIFNKFCIGK